MTLQLRKDDLAWQELDGEIVVLDLRSSTYFVINGSGTQLWERLAADASTDDLAEELASAYDLPPAAAREHTADFVSELRHKGLLEP
jgi:hypothetical protein